MGYSKAFLLLGLLLAIVLVISSQVSAKDLHNNKNAADPNGLNDAKYGGGGYQGDPGRGGYGGNPGRGGYGGNPGRGGYGGNPGRGGHGGDPGRGGYGGGPGHGRNGGGGYCYHGCCRRNYNGECRKCCDRAGQAVDAQPHH